VLHTVLSATSASFDTHTGDCDLLLSFLTQHVSLAQVQIRISQEVPLIHNSKPTIPKRLHYIQHHVRRFLLWMYGQSEEPDQRIVSHTVKRLLLRPSPKTQPRRSKRADLTLLHFYNMLLCLSTGLSCLQKATWLLPLSKQNPKCSLQCLSIPIILPGSTAREACKWEKYLDSVANHNYSLWKRSANSGTKQWV
jgi:hypothetical protein